MKKFQYIVVLLFVIVLGTGCSNDEKQENFLSETENEIENKEDGVIYEVYTGNWSNDGRTHDQILSEGGVELSCTITESNRLTGTLFAQQEMTFNCGKGSSHKVIKYSTSTCTRYLISANSEK